MELVFPAYIEKNLPILFASNDAFAPYMAVMIQSVIDHASKDKNYDIIILHGAISINNQASITAMASGRSNISIRFVDVDYIFNNADLYTGICDGRLSKETYYRLSAVQILSDEYEKVLYLDGDMIALTDIAELFTLDLDTYYLAAAYDISGIAFCHKPGNDRIHYRKNVLKLSDPDSYFIAGLLLLNMKLLRKDYPGGTLIKLAGSRPWIQHDQDVLNVICDDGKALLLHPEWNVLPDFGNNRFLPSALKDAWLESERHPKIVHYGGHRKPWNQTMVREEYFWKVAARTPFWNILIQNMLQSHAQYSNDERVLGERFEVIRKGVVSGSIAPRRNAILSELARIDGHSLPNNPLISVILPVYNEESRLNRCLNSLLNQTYKNLEIIIIDDGSTDGTPAICDRFQAQDPRIRVIHKTNGGVSSARNFGLRMAAGQYIGFVDADDWIACDMFEYLIAGAKRYRSPIVVCGHIWVDDNGNYKNCTWVNYRYEDETLMLEEALERMIESKKMRVYLCDKLFERWLFDGVQFEEGVLFEDLRIMHKLFQKSRWVTQLYLPKYYRCIHDNSIVTTNGIRNRLYAVQAQIQRYHELIGDFPSLKTQMLAQIGGSAVKLSLVIVKDSVENYRLYQYEIEGCTSFIRDNLPDILEAMRAGRWKKLAFALMLRGTRSGWVAASVLILLGKAKRKMLSVAKHAFIKYRKLPFKKHRSFLRHPKKEEKAHIVNEQAEQLKARLQYCTDNPPDGKTVEEVKKAFFLSLPKAEGNTALLQRGNLYLLRRLRDICRLHDIHFWLIGGTLLGAVRHKGFIPWDDDVDVAILRDDLSRLMAIIKDYPELNIDRYYHTNGAWQTVKLTFADDKLPFWIDLLLYDWAGDRSISTEKLWGKIQSARKTTVMALRAAHHRMNMKYSDMQIFDEKDAEEVNRAFAAGMAKLPAVLYRDYVYRSIDCVCGRWQQLFPIENMMPFVELEFEGDQYAVPKDYEWYLNLQYGDYYSIPDDIGHYHNRFVGDKVHNPELPGIVDRLEKEYYSKKR